MWSVNGNLVIGLTKLDTYFQNKFFGLGFGQFAAGVRHLHLAVPPSFTVVKGTQGFEEDPHGNVYY